MSASATTTATERTPLVFDDDPIAKEEAVLQEQIEALHETRTHVDAAIACLREHYVDGGRDRVTISSGYRAKVMLMIHITDFRQAVPILKALHAKGYHAKETSEFFEIDCRIYNYDGIEVRAFLPSDGSGACKRVKVGEETKPVYRYACPDTDVEAFNRESSAGETT